MPDDEKRVVTTMPLEIDRVTRPAGTDLTLPAADAEALVASGRAMWPGEPLELSDEERAKLPALGAPEGEPVNSMSTAPAAAPQTPAEEH